MLKIKNKPTNIILKEFEENVSSYSPQDIAIVKHELLGRGVDLTSLKPELRIILEGNTWTKAQIDEAIRDEIANQTREAIAKKQREDDEAFKKKIEALVQNGLDCYYQYKVIRLNDIMGATPLEKIQETLNEYALYGWRLRCSYTNELGHNSTNLSVGGIGGGTNYTSDEHVLILERKIRI